MSFLAPIFLLGALAVAAPILFHLIRRTTRDKTPFSSLMFLLPSPPRITKRSRLENIWLLLLRCLIIGLLALGFARPFLQNAITDAGTSAPGKKIVVLVDNSASMRRESLWSDALAKADDVLKKTGLADDVAVFTFDQQLHSLITFEEWRQSRPEDRAPLTSKRLTSASPGWAATHLGNALIRASEIFDQGGQTPTNVTRQIILISDLQEGSRLDGLQGHEWPRGVELILDPVKAKRTSNAGLQWVPESEEAAMNTADTGPRIRVSNAPDSKREQFKLSWATTGSNATPPLEIYVPRSQSRIVPAPKSNGSVGESLVLTGDDADFDNTVYLLPPKPSKLQLLFLGADGESDSTQLLYYLKRASQQTRRQIVDVINREPSQQLLPTDLQTAQLLIVSETPPEAQINAARDFARNGRIVLLPMKTTAAAQTLGKLLGIETLAASEASTSGYAMLGQIDFQHALFAPFADPRFSDFTKIHFWKHRRLDAAMIPNARVIAKFDNGDPAILQVPLGKGSVVVFTSGWQPADSQLALSSKFIPLLYSLIEQSANTTAPKAQYFVGEEVPLADSSQPLTVRKPDGNEVVVTNGSKFAQTDLPGIYIVQPTQQRFVVNLAAEESRTAPLSADQLEALKLPVKKTLIESEVTAVQKQHHLQAAELEGKQKLWRWLIVAAVVVLMVETWLAGRLTQRSGVETAAQT